MTHFMIPNYPHSTDFNLAISPYCFRTHRTQKQTYIFAIALPFCARLFIKIPSDSRMTLRKQRNAPINVFFLLVYPLTAAFGRFSHGEIFLLHRSPLVRHIFASSSWEHLSTVIRVQSFDISVACSVIWAEAVYHLGHVSLSGRILLRMAV